MKEGRPLRHLRTPIKYTLCVIVLFICLTSHLGKSYSNQTAKEPNINDPAYWDDAKVLESSQPQQLQRDSAEKREQNAPYEYITIKKNRFSLELPTGWMEVSHEALASIHEKLKQLAPDASIPQYDYGFQRKTASNGLEYPYILIRVLNTGRIPEHQLKSMQKIDLKNTLRDMSSDLPAVISNTTAGQLYYDESAHIVWGTLQGDVNGVGIIQGLIGMIPTQNGYVTMYAYSEEKSFKSFVPLFRAIIASTTIDPDLAYKLQLTDRSPVERVAYQAIVGGVAGGIIALLLVFFRKEQRRS